MTAGRRAGVRDARSLAECHVACWREAYAGLVPPALLAGLDVGERTERWRHVLAEPAWSTFVATAEAEVVGFAAAGPARDTDPVPQTELFALYVRTHMHGTGLADRLLTAALGTGPAYLWVFEANPRARAFYERHGFAPDGTRKPDPATGVPEVRMVRPASGPDALRR